MIRRKRSPYSFSSGLLELFHDFISLLKAEIFVDDSSYGRDGVFTYVLHCIDLPQLHLLGHHIHVFLGIHSNPDTAVQ